MQVPVSYFFEGLSPDGAAPFADPKRQMRRLLPGSSSDVVELSETWPKVASVRTQRAVLGLVRALSDNDDDDVDHGGGLLRKNG